MKNLLKKTALLALSGTMVVGSLAGCSNSVDGTKTVATVNDDELKLGTLNLMLRYQQAQTAQMYQMYFGGSSDGIWDTVADEESGETYGEQTINDVVEQVEDMMILRQHAKEYEITISDDQKEQITETAKTFMESNDEETITKLGVDQGMVEELLELYTYNTNMYDPLTKDVDTEVADEEAQQTGVTFVKVEAASTDDAADSTDTAAADPKEKAQQILDEVLATADADMDAIAKGVDDTLSATTTHYTTNPAEGEEDTDTVPQEVQDVCKKLTDGEVASELVEVDGTYYVVRLDAAFDEDATNDEKTTIVNDRKQEAYDETTGQWRDDSTIKVEDKVLKSVRLRDNDKYSFKEAEETDETTTDTAEDATVTEAAEDTATEETATEETSADDAAAEDTTAEDSAETAE